jgi:hypothetical protein
MARLHGVPLRNAKRLPHEHVKDLDPPTPTKSAASLTKPNAAPKSQSRQA